MQLADSAHLAPPLSVGNTPQEPPIAIPSAHRRSFVASDDVRSSWNTATLNDPAISSSEVNLAVSLASKWQLKVGLFDADVYGPSIPTMMKIHGKPETNQDLKMIPKENYGVGCMSMGLLVEKDAPIVWRGPMVMSVLQKLAKGVEWEKLDILVVEMPPVIVSAPQDISLMDARRGAQTLSKVDVPILGAVENMSCFKCPHCGEPSYIFGEGGARRTAHEMSLEYLGKRWQEMYLNELVSMIVKLQKPILISRAKLDTKEDLGTHWQPSGREIDGVSRR
ncbi:Iron-sulfur protein required for NADH dehydrogenase, mitochondrial-like protein [Drosera capensis]